MRTRQDGVENRDNGLLLHPNTAQGSFFPLESYSKKTLRKNVPKSAIKYKRNVLPAPWASYNTPYYSFKIFPQFRLAKSTRIIHHKKWWTVQSFQE